MDETASKDWKILLGKASDAPPEPSLFDRVGLEIKKNRLDHRENDSRAVSSCVCQLLSDSNNIQLGTNDRVSTTEIGSAQLFHIESLLCVRWVNAIVFLIVLRIDSSIFERYSSSQ